VPVGGFVIFDDIRSHPGVQDAWRDFQADQMFVEPITHMPEPDAHGAWFRKRHKVAVNGTRRSK
jgi:Macrocin-O-methyltransferase (TylF)